MRNSLNRLLNLIREENMDKKYVCWYKLTRSLFFESIASNQKHPKFLVEVFLQDQAPYEEKSLIKSKNSEDSDSYRMK